MLYEIVARSYSLALARPRGQRINDVILHLALRARGYNNHSSLAQTGEERFLRKFAKTRPALVIDIGANVGGYSQLILDYTKAIVFAFEPLPLAFKRLESLRRRYPSRMLSFNVALGAQEEDLPIYFGEDTSPLASLSKEVNQIDYVGRSNVNSTTVPVRTLDGFADQLAVYSQQIDLIKIDTEGYEWEVLMGSMTLISEFRPKFIQIEFNAHHLFMKRTLLEIGRVLPSYSLFQLLPYGSGMVERSLSDPFTNFFAFSNFVFVNQKNLGDLFDFKNKGPG